MLIVEDNIPNITPPKNNAHYKYLSAKYKDKLTKMLIIKEISQLHPGESLRTKDLE